MDEESVRRRRRWRVLILCALVLLLGYPVLLVVSTRAGLSLGLQRDVNAQRDLVRALNYAGDRDKAVRFGSDAGQPPIAPLDSRALTGLPSLDPGSVQGPPPAGTAPTSAPPRDSPVPPARPAPPPSRPVPPPPPPGPPPPTRSCSSLPTGSDHLKLHAGDQIGAPVAGASVRIYYQGCPFATGTTNGDGQMNNVNNLAQDSIYSYVVSASGYHDATGSFDTRNSSNSNVVVDVVMTRS